MRWHRKIQIAAALVLIASAGYGGISHQKRLTIDFTDSVDASSKAAWSAPEKIAVSKEGLGWDGEAASSWDGWIHTKPLALGLSWRPTHSATIRVAIHPPSTEVVLANGQKSTPYGGDVYFRYSPDLKHWSSWQVLRRLESQPSNEINKPSRFYEATVRVPYRAREKYGKLLSEYTTLDVAWTSDEEAAVRWILDRDPDFFSKNQPFIGYVEFLFEGSFHGGQRIKSFQADISYGMSGIHIPPKDKAAYVDRDSSPWRFKADERKQE